MEHNEPVRLYYGQVVWLDQVGTDTTGKIVYRFNELPGHGYGYGDLFLADAAAFRPLTSDDVSPINPNVDPATKKITVDLTPEHQTLSCFEGKNEVYFCRISSGDDQAQFSTPVGDQAVGVKNIFDSYVCKFRQSGRPAVVMIRWRFRGRLFSISMSARRSTASSGITILETRNLMAVST